MAKLTRKSLLSARKRLQPFADRTRKQRRLIRRLRRLKKLASFLRVCLRRAEKAVNKSRFKSALLYKPELLTVNSRRSARDRTVDVVERPLVDRVYSSPIEKLWFQRLRKITRFNQPYFFDWYGLAKPRRRTGFNFRRWIQRLKLKPVRRSYRIKINLLSLATIKEFASRFVAGGLSLYRSPARYRYITPSQTYLTENIRPYDWNKISMLYRVRKRLPYKLNYRHRVGLSFTDRNFPIMDTIGFVDYDVPIVKFWRDLRITPPSASQQFLVGLLGQKRLGDLSRQVFGALFDFGLNFRKHNDHLPRIDVKRLTLSHRFSLARRRRRRRRLLRCYKKSVISPRWKSSNRPKRSWNTLRSRWVWSHQRIGSYLTGREQLINPSNLFNRLSVMESELRKLRSLKKKVRTRYIYLRPLVVKPKTRFFHRERCNYYFRRRVRLRRFVDQEPRIGTYYERAVSSSFSVYHRNRFASLETTNLLQSNSFIGFIFSLMSHFRFSNGYQTSLHYNYFQSSPYSLYRRPTDDRDRYSSSSRRKRGIKMGKHPYWGPALERYRSCRVGLLHNHKLNLSLDLDEKVPVPPRHNFFTVLFASRVETRRKFEYEPAVEGRSKFALFFSFCSGLVTELASTSLPFNIGLLFNYNRTSIKMEKEFSSPPPKTRVVRLVQISNRIRSWTTSTVFPGRSLIKFYCWFYLFTPLWYVYYFLCLFYSFLILRARYFLEDIWYGFIGWNKIILRLTFWPVLSLYRFIKKLPVRMRYWRFFRTLEWVYTSWLYVYVIYDRDYEQQANSQTLDGENYEYPEEDWDPAGDMGVDLDQDLDYSFDQLTEPRFSWSTWWNSPTSQSVDEMDLLDESFIELVFDELGYFIQLVTKPFFDFFVNLPLWGFLELITLLFVTFKTEFQTKWYYLLTYGNTTKVVGRWWKIPLVLLKCSFRWLCWFISFVWLQGQMTLVELKLLVTYNMSLTWFDEYYLIWLGVAFLISTYLVGPPSIREYCFDELGLEGFLFLLYGSSVLSRNEVHQPNRSGTYLGKITERSHNVEHTMLVQDGFDSNGFGYFSNDDPLVMYDEIRLVLSQHKTYTEIPGRELDDHYVFPSRHDEPEGEQLRQAHYVRDPLRRPNYYHRDRFSFSELLDYEDAGHETEHARYDIPSSSSVYFNRTHNRRKQLSQSLQDNLK